MNGKRYLNKKVDKKKFMLYFLILFFISIMIFSSVKIVIWFKENKKSSDLLEEVSSVVIKNIETINDNEEENEYSIDFEKLKEKNSDTIAWLIVNGVNLEFPVVKTTNNDFYINHTFDKTYSRSGWIFMDYKNKFDGTDKNIVIYGHNRKDGSMFGKLKNILTNEWQKDEKNLIVYLIDENGTIEYEVFSIYKIESEDYYITTDFKTDNSYEKFINNMKKRSIRDFNKEVTTNDQILTLSTCADDNRYRIVLHAKKLTK